MRTKEEYLEYLDILYTTWYPVDLMQSGKITDEEVGIMFGFNDAYKKLKELIDNLKENENENRRIVD